MNDFELSSPVDQEIRKYKLYEPERGELYEKTLVNFRSIMGDSFEIIGIEISDIAYSGSINWIDESTRRLFGFLGNINAWCALRMKLKTISGDWLLCFSFDSWLREYVWESFIVGPDGKWNPPIEENIISDFEEKLRNFEEAILKNAQVRDFYQKQLISHRPKDQISKRVLELAKPLLKMAKVICPDIDFRRVTLQINNSDAFFIRFLLQHEECTDIACDVYQGLLLAFVGFRFDDQNAVTIRLPTFSALEVGQGSSVNFSSLPQKKILKEFERVVNRFAFESADFLRTQGLNVKTDVAIHDYYLENIRYIEEYAWKSFEMCEKLGCTPKGSCPVFYFGDLSKYQKLPRRIVTVGKNPSFHEFDGHIEMQELRGFNKIRNERYHLNDIGFFDERFTDYFQKKPYWRWFKPLDVFIAALGFGEFRDGVIHTDFLTPIATQPTWNEFEKNHKDASLEVRNLGIKIWLETMELLRPEVVVITMGHSVFDDMKTSLNEVGLTFEMVLARKQGKIDFEIYKVEFPNSAKSFFIRVGTKNFTSPFATASHDEVKAAGMLCAKDLSILFQN
jgi:hypothetical protein